MTNREIYEISYRIKDSTNRKIDKIVYVEADIDDLLKHIETEGGRAYVRGSIYVLLHRLVKTTKKYLEEDYVACDMNIELKEEE